jgi:thiosulfate reductase cytochrome b subunit
VTRFLLAVLAGWIAVLGVGIEIALPYMLRSSAQAAKKTRQSKTLRERMRLHIWLGYGLAALVTVHVAAEMAAEMTAGMAREGAAGVWAATVAWVLVFTQVGLGMYLQSGGPERQRVRRMHFAGMLMLSGLVVVHLWNNGR